MNKKIAIICEYTIFPERLGGMDRFFVAYNTALKKEGCEPTWFFKEVETFDFYKELKLKNAKGLNLEQYFLNYLKVEKVHFDIVLTHFLQPVSSFFKEIKKLLPSTKIMNVDHNPRPLEGFPLKKRIKNKVKGFLYAKYIQQFVGVSDYTSNYILKDFGRHLQKRTKTVYNGIDISSCKKQALDRTKAPFNFIVVSHLRASKGIQDLLIALSFLNASLLKKLSIHIYGEGPYESQLKSLCNSLNLNQVVEFKGSTPKVNEILSNYHYLIQPTYMECFSLSLLESLACNVPVITTNVGGNTELVEDGVSGFIFKPKDAKKISIILAKIVQNEIGISGNVSTLVEKEFTLEKMVENHVNLLK